MKKLAILSIIAFVLTFAFMLSNTTQAWAGQIYRINEKSEGFTMSSARGWKICDRCAHKHTKCVYCSKQLTINTKVFPIVCKECRERELCAICGHKCTYKNSSYHADKWDAYLCQDCAKAKKNGYECVKCGKDVKNWGW